MYLCQYVSVCPKLCFALTLDVSNFIIFETGVRRASRPSGFLLFILIAWLWPVSDIACLTWDIVSV